MVAKTSIPEGWSTQPLLSILSNLMDYRGRTPRKLGMEWGGGTIPALSARNVRMGSIDLNQETYLGSEDLYQRWMASGDVKRGDIVFTTEAPLGNVAMIPDNRKYILSQRTVLFQVDSDLADDAFLFQYLMSEGFTDLLAKNASGSTAKGIQRRRLEKLPVLLPSVGEQRYIAAALSEADNLIGTLGKLIAKKRAIKQATMQRLLTGKTRLAGFGGEWRHCTLGELGQLFKGKGIRRDDVRSDGVPCVRYGELYTRYHNYVTNLVSRVSRTTATDAQPIRYGDLLFTGSGETIEEIGKCVAYVGREPAVAGGDIVILRSAGRHNAVFLGHLLNHDRVAQQKARLGQGDAVVHVSARALAQIELEIPLPAEQSAIASVLVDMDAEIEALSSRMAKTKDIKLGMMQELLTGRTRLVGPKGVAA